MDYADKDYDEYPHTPDVFERETEDNGFSRDWGMHFQPSERYLIDCHTHAESRTDYQLSVNKWFDWATAWRMAKIIVADGHPKTLRNAFSNDPFSYDQLAAIAKEDNRIGFLYAPGVDTPDAEPLEEALILGARGVKLWSPTFILEARPPDEFEYPKWEKFFKIVNDKNLPTLWHVTQRMTSSPYTGGGLKAYWSEGWKKGVKYANEDLLQSFLRIVKSYPNGRFIGAHQLYLGWDRLEEIFDEYPNVYIDTSIGCFVRWGDVMYPQDQKRIRSFFMKYADRIVFGTDIGIGRGWHEETCRLALIGYINFLRQLRLPYDKLQMISHQNAETLFLLEKSSDVRIGNIRP